MKTTVVSSIIAVLMGIFGTITVTDAMKSNFIPQKTIWNPKLINSDFVQISVIKKSQGVLTFSGGILATSTTDKYELSRVISTSTPNDGEYTYVPLARDEYLQIFCIPQNPSDSCNAIVKAF